MTTCLLIWWVFRFETPITVRAAAQRGNASVPVNFRAFTEDGTPVVDLEAEDVSIEVNGKERTVTSRPLRLECAREAQGVEGDAKAKADAPRSQLGIALA